MCEWAEIFKPGQNLSPRGTPENDADYSNDTDARKQVSIAGFAKLANLRFPRAA